MTYINRRHFIGTAVAGIGSLCAAGLFSVSSATAPSSQKKAIYICSICGHIEFGTIPATCPMCRSAKEVFEANDAIFSESETKFKDVAQKHIPIVSVRKKSELITEGPSISVQVKIGNPIHPSTDSHRIRFIDCYIDDVYTGCFLPKINSYPAVGFEIKTPGSTVRVVALCSQHGYWQTEISVG
jgi:desulfoferrodoxin-like iron-binding protein